MESIKMYLQIINVHFFNELALSNVINMRNNPARKNGKLKIRIYIKILKYIYKVFIPFLDKLIYFL
jgi:hypothetical protein